VEVCWLTGVERTARVLRDMAAQGDAIDWWQLGAARPGRSASVARGWIFVSAANACSTGLWRTPAEL
jgi:hypothetical protein